MTTAKDRVEALLQGQGYGQGRKLADFNGHGWTQWAKLRDTNGAQVVNLRDDGRLAEIRLTIPVDTAERILNPGHTTTEVEQAVRIEVAAALTDETETAWSVDIAKVERIVRAVTARLHKREEVQVSG